MSEAVFVFFGKGRSDGSSNCEGVWFLILLMLLILWILEGLQVVDVVDTSMRESSWVDFGLVGVWMMRWVLES